MGEYQRAEAMVAKEITMQVAAAEVAAAFDWLRKRLRVLVDLRLLGESPAKPIAAVLRTLASSDWKRISLPFQVRRSEPSVPAPHSQRLFRQLLTRFLQLK